MIPDCLRLTSGTSGGQVHHTQTMWWLVVRAHPENFHGDSSHLKRRTEFQSRGGGKKDKHWIWRRVAYILWVGLCCIVWASHNQTVQSHHGTVASLFGLPQHHWDWFWSIKRYLPDPMCCTRILQGRWKLDLISSNEGDAKWCKVDIRSALVTIKKKTYIRNGIGLWDVFLSLSLSFGLCIRCSHVVWHLKQEILALLFMTTHTIIGPSCKVTYFHVVPVAENLSGGPPGVGARLHHIMSEHVWWTLAVHFEFQANVKCCVFLQIKPQKCIHKGRFCSVRTGINSISFAVCHLCSNANSFSGSSFSSMKICYFCLFHQKLILV